jgi:phage tail protein X
MEYLEYITKDNDRWDLIAYQMYGDATDYERLLSANPQYATLSVLPAGLKLIIPVIEDIEAKQEVNPPWITD